MTTIAETKPSYPKAPASEGGRYTDIDGVSFRQLRVWKLAS
jgi:hypothetical protein